MKRIIAFFLSMIFIASLWACSSKKSDDKKSTSSAQLYYDEIYGYKKLFNESYDVLGSLDAKEDIMLSDSNTGLEYAIADYDGKTLKNVYAMIMIPSEYVSDQDLTFDDAKGMCDQIRGNHRYVAVSRDNSFFICIKDDAKNYNNASKEEMVKAFNKKGYTVDATKTNSVSSSEITTASEGE